ncbi:unnamed protein product, partial [Rhizoctonia solani]
MGQHFDTVSGFPTISGFCAMKLDNPDQLITFSTRELFFAFRLSDPSSDESVNYTRELHTSNLIPNDQAIFDPESQKVAREIVRRLALHECENLTDHVDHYSFSHLPLFKGGFGDVYRGNLFSGLRVAVKTPHISLNVLDENPEYMEDVAREIHTWSKCDHPNVLNFLGLVVFRGQIGMVAPWMENGSLPRYLERTLSADRCKLCTQVCDGVIYLHKIGIVHGDLKGENVLVSSEGVVVVSDFGGLLLKNRSLKIVPLEKGLCFTSPWAAPELLDGDEEGINTRESDVYALGMTILEAITGKLPWYWLHRDLAVMKQVCSLRNQHRRPEGVILINSQDGDKLWNLLTTCWSFEPEKRPNAVDVGEIMRTITPGGLKAHISPTMSGRCVIF